MESEADHRGDEASIPRRRLAFVAAAAGLVAGFAASASPVPLYNLYRAQDGFTNADLSLTVVAYFVGTISALLVLGRISNHLGRRWAGVITLTVLAAGALILLDVTSIWVVVAGRVLMGIGAGMASSSLTAYVVDASPRTPVWLAAVVSSQAPMLGLTLGAIGSGALVQYGPWPRDLVYLIDVALLLLCAGLILISPETLSPRPGLVASLRPRLHVPARTRHLLPITGAVFLSTWATGAFFQAFVPGLTVTQLHTSNALLFGLVFSSYMAPSILGAPLGGRFLPATAQRIGMSIFLVGMGGLITGLAVGSLAVFIVSALVAGTGQGIGVSASLRAMLHGSPLDERAPIFAAVFLMSYVGAAIPALVSGQLSQVFSLFQIASAYGVLAIVCTAAVLVFARNPR